MSSILDLPPFDKAVRDARRALTWANNTADLDAYEMSRVTQAAAELVESVEAAREHQRIRHLNEAVIE